MFTSTCETEVLVDLLDIREPFMPSPSALVPTNVTDSPFSKNRACCGDSFNFVPFTLAFENAIKNSRQEKFYEFLIAFFIERLQHIIYNTSQGKRFYEKLYQKRVCYNSPNYG